MYNPLSETNELLRFVRIPHVRGTSTVGDDGVKTVEVELFNPIGTVFELHSGEPERRGGTGSAPSAISYVSAGLGFCFMTQVGRYADIVDKELSSYRIAQDTHFTFDAREQGETPGNANPVETHLFLDIDEEHESARDILEMSEQTCFLHALCRTDLEETKVDVNTP